ncbi:hypothetical protein V6N12_055021 [Hibiscus sabdariffa]|uniref:Uncharacterized protein n=1 Tax=Hibiscus sabdariffa TaxID=183260 RepID=A0ABR2D265_9ROSI
MRPIFTAAILTNSVKNTNRATEDRNGISFMYYRRIVRRETALASGSLISGCYARLIPQDAIGPPSTARKNDMVDATTSMATPFSIQTPDVSFSRQDYRGMYAMKASNYNEGAMNLAPQSSWNIMPTYGSYNSVL